MHPLDGGIILLCPLLRVTFIRGSTVHVHCSIKIRLDRVALKLCSTVMIVITLS